MNTTRLKGAITLTVAAALAVACSGQDDAPAEADMANTGMGDTTMNDNGMAMSSTDNAGMEECYGIAMAGQNDGTAADGTGGQGTSVVGYQGDAWTYVDEGTWTTTANGNGTMGSPSRRSSAHLGLEIAGVSKPTSLILSPRYQIVSPSTTQVTRSGPEQIGNRASSRSPGPACAV